jgi:hypothetical protein
MATRAIIHAWACLPIRITGTCTDIYALREVRYRRLPKTNPRHRRRLIKNKWSKIYRSSVAQSAETQIQVTSSSPSRQVVDEMITFFDAYPVSLGRP